MDSISVCIATFNGEKFIYQQLISILSQLDTDDEVIISDDHSTDKTLKIVENIDDNRVKVDTNQGYSGPLGNFEAAIKRSTGRFILLADQDDIWMIDKVKIVKAVLQSYDLILSDCQVVTEKGDIIHNSFFAYRGSKQGFWYNLYKNSYVGCCMAFRREIMEYIMPFPKQIHMHDWWIGLLVDVKGKVCFYPDPLIKYIRHGNNASPTGEAGYSIFKKIMNRVVLLIYIIKRLFKFFYR